MSDSQTRIPMLPPSGSGPAAAPRDQRGFHIMTKPIGPRCNLACDYCFYLDKETLYAPDEKWRMSDDLLEQYIRQYIESQDAPEVSFAWQGGEPTLLGVDFFRRVVQLQGQYANGKRISNALQTNGTLLDDQWCEFLAANSFLVGLSIDGPRQLHDRYRVDKHRRPTFDAVMRGVELLKCHKTEFNTLTVVNRLNSQHPLEVYQFLKDIGSRFLQFIPLVERAAAPPVPGQPIHLAPPPAPEDPGTSDVSVSAAVTPWSVDALQFGRFMADIFDRWVRHDVGTTFVQLFDVALGTWMGLPPSLCVFSQQCGAAMALEHNGDLYSCDHYVYPRHKLGSLREQSLTQMAHSPQQLQFGRSKSDSLPQQCRQCPWLFACNGECPKHRFCQTEGGQAGLNYLCPGYKHFFSHVDPHMRRMAELLHARRAAAEIMPELRQADQAARQTATWRLANRNDPCPCGSGRKFKNCCAEKA